MTDAPTDPTLAAFAQLAAILLSECGVEDAEPGSMTALRVELGTEVYVRSTSRGRIRIGIIPEAALEARADAIRLARN